MFCSVKCCEETYKNFNGKDELIQDSLRGCEIRQKMLRIMNESLSAANDFNDLQTIFANLKNQTVFDFDVSNPSDNELKKKLLICVSSLLPKTDCGVVDSLKSNLNIPDSPKKDFFISFISRVILNYLRNGVKVPGINTNLPEGGMLLSFVSLINHSCDPNTYSSFIENKCYIFVIKPVAAGEQISNSYR